MIKHGGMINDDYDCCVVALITGKHHLANSWEEKVLKVRLEMLSMADVENKSAITGALRGIRCRTASVLGGSRQ